MLCNLDGYCSNNSTAVNSGTPNAFCGQVENNNWVAFIAGSPSFILKITVSNCNQNKGMQAQIFSTDDCQNFTSFSNCIDPVTSTATLSATNLTIGQKYYLMMDGKVGDVCNYEYEMIEGFTLSPAHAEIEPAGTLCESNTLTLDAVATSPNSSLTYHWSTSDGMIISDIQSSSIVIVAEGTYQVKVEDSGGCTDSTEITIPIFPPPQITIDTPDTINCLNNTEIAIHSGSDNTTDSFEWSTQNGNFVSGQTTPNPIVNAPGIYEITVTSSDGCYSAASIEVFIDIESPIANATGGGELNCITPSIILDGTSSSAGSNFVYSWTTDTGNFLSGQNALNPEVNGAGTYTLEVTNSTNNCTATADVIVTLNDDEPTSAFFSVTNPCFGESTGEIIIDSIQGGTQPYLYSFDGMTFQTSNSKSSLLPSDYQVIVQDATGCQWDTVITITEQPELIVNLGDDIKKIELGDVVELIAQINFPPQQIDSIIWTPAFECYDCYHQTVTPVQTSEYKIKVIDTNGCSESDKIVIFVDKKRAVYIPNAFSPNNDGINDYFIICGGKGISEILDFKIFNRWGVLVASYHNFQPNDYKFGWNGTMNGKALDSSVFVYLAGVKFIDGEIIIFKGNFSLMR